MPRAVWTDPRRQGIQPEQMAHRSRGLPFLGSATLSAAASTLTIRIPAVDTILIQGFITSTSIDGPVRMAVGFDGTIHTGLDYNSRNMLSPPATATASFYSDIKTAQASWLMEYSRTGDVAGHDDLGGLTNRSFFCLIENIPQAQQKIGKWTIVSATASAAVAPKIKDGHGHIFAGVGKRIDTIQLLVASGTMGAETTFGVFGIR